MDIVGGDGGEYGGATCWTREACPFDGDVKPVCRVGKLARIDSSRA
jgi:hypothetical protein